MTVHAPLTVQLAQTDDLERVNKAYAAFGYPAGAEPSDTVFLAERGDEIVGLVRATLEHGVTMLRGMYVAPTAQRQGVGNALLRAFVERLGKHDCYCLPYTHLVGFYGTQGFYVLESEHAPTFLAKRLADYRADGGNVLIMYRPKNP